jgi:hypothetical protein
MHTWLRVRLVAGGHPGAHAVPAGQHVNAVPLPHGVVRAGHPQKLCAGETHATPLLQH